MQNISSFFTVKYHAKLHGFGGFAVTGVDADNFLQGQLTNDVSRLAPGLHQRTGYCTPKGRLLATMLQWRIDDHSMAHVLPAGVMESTVKRLKMFVLRSKVTFSPADQGVQVFGLWGTPTAKAIELVGNDLNGAVIGLNDKGPSSADDKGGDEVSCRQRTGQGPWLLMESPCPVLGVRAWVVALPSDGQRIKDELARTQELPESAWDFSEIQNAKPWVAANTQEAFVPQMINFELVNGVSFTKGCYPGQEVVARSQYLGKLKRRMYRADVTDTEGLQRVLSKLTMPVGVSASIAMLTGKDIWSESMASEPCGQVVNASPRFNAEAEILQGASLLISCTSDVWENTDCHLIQPDGPALISLALPYAIPAAA